MVAWGANPVLLGGDWSSSGDQKDETLCPLLFSIFNAFLAFEPLQYDADLILGGMVLAHGAANIADQFFGWHPRGWECPGPTLRGASFNRRPSNRQQLKARSRL